MANAAMFTKAKESKGAGEHRNPLVMRWRSQAHGSEFSPTLLIQRPRGSANPERHCFPLRRNICRHRLGWRQAARCTPDSANRSVRRKRSSGTSDRRSVHSHFNHTTADMIRILDPDHERTSGAYHRYLSRAPGFREARIDVDVSILEPHAQYPLDTQPQRPGSGPGIPSPSTAPRVRGHTRHVCGEHIGFHAVALSVGAGDCVLNRVDEVEDAPSAITIAKPYEGEAQPRGCMRILATILANSRWIRLNIAGIAGRFVEGRPEQSD